MIIYILDNVVLKFREESRRFRLKESGGVLLGYRTKRNDYVVTHSSGPGPKAVHGLFSFRPDTKYFQEKLDEIFEATEGRITYLGEWHTHPIWSKPKPSYVDIETMEMISTTECFRTENPLLFIVPSRECDVSLLLSKMYIEVWGISDIYIKTKLITEIPEYNLYEFKST